LLNQYYLQMKKIILLPSIAVILFSCGPSAEESANAKKNFLQSLDSMNAKLEEQVNDYCKCLETGTVDECNDKYQVFGATWLTVSKQTDDSYKYKVTPEESKMVRDKTNELFDKKATCVKEAMANTITDADGKTHRVASSADSSASTDKTTSSESTGNTTATKKSAEKTKSTEKEKEHHSEKKSDNDM